MSVSSKYMKTVVERAIETGEAYRKDIRAQFEGSGMGQSSLNAEDHRTWFERHAQGWWEDAPAQDVPDPMTGQMTSQVPQEPDPSGAIDPATGMPMTVPVQVFRDGPNWVRALSEKKEDGSAMVDGGPAEVERYIKGLVQPIGGMSNGTT